MGKEEERLGHRIHRARCRSKRGSSVHPTAAKWLHHIHHTHEQRRREEATMDGHYQAVLSLLCLWPYGNSLIVSSHSEFYQCHTQNRSHYHATSEASRSVHERRSHRQSRAMQTRLPTLVRRLKTTEFRQERYMGRNSPGKREEHRSFRLPCGWTRALSNRSIKGQLNLSLINPKKDKKHPHLAVYC